MSDVIAIGSYDDVSKTAIDDHGWVHVPALTDAMALDEETRKAARAIAYKSGESFGGEAMDAFPQLALIANYGVGYDMIDIGAASDRGIAVTNTPEVLNDDVADLAVAMLLMQMRGMRQADHLVRSGGWAAGDSPFPLQRKVSGRKIGICGLGRIGRTIAERLAAFDCEIHYTSRSAKDTPGWTYHDDPLSLAKAVEIYIVALVGGPDTQNMVSAEVISAIGPDGVLVNISRGSTVDEDALLSALESGRLAGAGLDVFENEPKVDPRFLKLDNVVLQPHQASATHETRAAMGALQRENIDAFLNGKTLPTTVV